LERQRARLAAGLCLFTVAAGYALALWAMRVNRFFSAKLPSMFGLREAGLNMPMALQQRADELIE
jgi:hypothetical protein